MGQANSTNASPESDGHHYPHHHSSSSPPSTYYQNAPSSGATPVGAGNATPTTGNPVGGSSHMPQLPSVDDMRNMTHRILASTSDTLRQLRDNMPAVELPKFASSTSSSTPESASADHASSSLPHSDSTTNTSSAGWSKPILDQDLLDDHVTMITSHDQQPLLVFKPHAPTSNTSNKDTSLTEVIKVHYHLSAKWIKRNATTIAIGVAVVGVTAVVGTMAYRAVKAHRQKRRLNRVVRGRGGAKREVVVITSVATLEGVTLALALEQQGFIVFVGVEDHAKADEVNAWGRHDIHPIVLDPSKPHVVEEFVGVVNNFLDLRNSELLGLGLPVTSSNNQTREPSGSMILQEELSSSTANIQLLRPSSDFASATKVGLYPSLTNHADVTKQEWRATTEDQGAPVFRLAAVIVNPQVTAIGTIEHVDLDQWRHAIDVNITGTLVVLQKFMPLLRRTMALPKVQRRSPRVLLLSSSVTGNLGLPHQSVLSASHHALESLADSFRREVKHQGIDVVCLKPGIIESSERKALNNSQQQGKIAGSKVGLFGSFDWSTTFARASTTVALQEAVYDAVTIKHRPPAYQAMGSGSAAYSFVAWAVPRSMVDWSIRRNPPKIVSRTVKVTATPSPNSTA